MPFRLRVLLGIILCAPACGSSSPTSPDLTTIVAAYGAEVVTLFQAHSYYRDRIDWASVRSQVAEAAAVGKSKTDTVLLAISLVGDNHSWYQPIAGNLSTPFSFASCIAGAPAPPAFVPPNDIGYVAVPGFGLSGDAATVFAAGLQSQIQQADRPGLAGWIVDLRQNGGGNMWPMVAGVGPILGEGLAGYFVDSQSVASSWGYSQGSSWIGTYPQTTVPATYHLIAPDPRVAVLTDSRTNSSGEAVTVAFRTRPNTRSFGGTTCGRGNAISAYPLSDGGKVGVMTAIDADRTGFRYGGVIVPDETIGDPNDLTARAVQWLRSRQ